MVDTEKLKVLRCQKKFFRAADFARALGMTPVNYWNREKGKVKFSANEVVRVCELLDISLEEGISILL